MGFLGVGKTSAILNLLKQKPRHEKWAVLVNEFGSIGIDGAIYASRGVQVKEVSGGCMCCTAGVPLQVAINKLLKETQPNRLLIEPTGLGHPKRVIDTLRGEHFKSVLSLHASICLVDPNNLKDERYTGHENFIDQIALCDILIANKTDLADTETLQLFDQLADKSQPKKLLVSKTQFGKLDRKWLDLRFDTPRKAFYPAHHSFQVIPEQTNTQLISKPSLEIPVQDGFKSTGWIFPLHTQFHFECIKKILGDLDVERVKAILKTDKGWYVFNANSGQMGVTKIEEMTESRLEIIGTELDRQTLEEQIERCKTFT